MPDNPRLKPLGSVHFLAFRYNPRRRAAIDCGRAFGATFSTGQRHQKLGIKKSTIRQPDPFGGLSGCVYAI